MISHYITFSISITFISWIVGMILGEILKRATFYKKLSNFNFFKSKRLNQRIGINVFRWIVKNTFFKFFNSKITLKNKYNTADLEEIRKEMTYAEINHLIGFCIVTVFAFVELIRGNYLFALIFIIVNILMNLYPSLLQQENKRRIDRLIKIVR